MSVAFLLYTGCCVGIFDVVHDVDITILVFVSGLKKRWPECEEHHRRVNDFARGIDRKDKNYLSRHPGESQTIHRFVLENRHHVPISWLKPPQELIKKKKIRAPKNKWRKSPNQNRKLRTASSSKCVLHRQSPSAASSSCASCASCSHYAPRSPCSSSLTPETNAFSSSPWGEKPSFTATPPDATSYFTVTFSSS